MAGSLEETIGARLKVLGRTAFVADLSLASKAMNEYADAADRAAAASDKMSAGSKTAAGSQAESAAAQKASADATVAASDRQIEAADASALAAGRSSSAVKSAANDTAKHVSRISSAAGQVAKWGSVAIAGIGYESIKTYTQFQQAMEQVSTQAGIAQKRLPVLTRGAIGISVSTGETLSNVADQLYRIASASGGMHDTNKELLSLTKAAADLTVLGGPTTDPEQTARIFGAVATSGIGISPGSSGASASQIAAWANATVGGGDMRMQDLVSAMGTGILTSGKAYGVGLNNIGAWMDIMTSQGMSGQKSGTLINHALSLLATPSQSAATVEHLFGINRGQLAQEMRTKGLGATATTLKAAMQHVMKDPNFYTKFYGAGTAGETEYLKAAQFTPAQIATMEAPGHKGGLSKNMVMQMLTTMFGGAKQETPILLLMNELGLFKQKLAGIKGQSTTSVFNKDLANTLGESANQIKILDANLKAVGYTIGKDITPDFIEFLHVLEGVGNWFGKHPNVLKGLLIGGGAIVGGSIVYKTGEDVVKVVKGSASLVKILGSKLGVGTSTASSTSLGGAAATMQTAADTMLTAADRMAGTGTWRSAAPGAGSAVVGGADAAGGLSMGEIIAGGGSVAAGATGAFTLAGVALPLTATIGSLLFARYMEEKYGGPSKRHYAKVRKTYEKILGPTDSSAAFPGSHNPYATMQANTVTYGRAHGAWSYSSTNGNAAKQTSMMQSQVADLAAKIHAPAAELELQAQKAGVANTELSQAASAHQKAAAALETAAARQEAAALQLQRAGTSLQDGSHAAVLAAVTAATKTYHARR